MATRRWPLQLSAVAAGDPSTEADLQRPKTYGHEGVAPICRREKRRRAERHQAETHYRHNAHGKRAAGDNRRAVEKQPDADRKSTRLNSSHGYISYAVFCLKKKKNS